MNKYEGIKTKINRELKNGKIVSIKPLNLNQLNKEVQMYELSDRQKETYKYNIMVYGNVYIEIIEKPTIFRRFTCWLNKNNPKYRIIDPRKIQPK